METERASSRLNYNITCGINKNANTTCRCLDFRAPSSNLLLLVSFFSMFSFSFFFITYTLTQSHFYRQFSDHSRHSSKSLTTNRPQKTPYPQSLFQSHERGGERERFAFLTDQKQLYSFMVNSLGFWESRSKSQIPIFPYTKIQTQQRFSIMTIIIPIKHG